MSGFCPQVSPSVLQGFWVSAVWFPRLSRSTLPAELEEKGPSGLFKTVLGFHAVGGSGEVRKVGGRGPWSRGDVAPGTVCICGTKGASLTRLEAEGAHVQPAGVGSRRWGFRAIS